MSDAARLEALGVDEVTFTWRDQRLTIPLRLEAWPLEDIRRVRFTRAIRILLSGQRLGLARPLLDDYRELSDAMADAVGVGRMPESPPAPDEYFGCIPTLLRLVNTYEDDVASDLRRFWGVDYKRRWARQDALTLREIWSYIRRSQPDSALAVANNGGKHVWRESDFIGASVYQALTGEVYPGRPLKAEELDKAIAAMRAKAEQADKLRSRREHYHGTAETSPASPVVGALAEAIDNRRREIGTPTDGK